MEIKPTRHFTQGHVRCNTRDEYFSALIENVPFLGVLSQGNAYIIVICPVEEVTKVQTTKVGSIFIGSHSICEQP